MISEKRVLIPIEFTKADIAELLYGKTIVFAYGNKIDIQVKLQE